MPEREIWGGSKSPRLHVRGSPRTYGGTGPLLQLDFEDRIVFECLESVRDGVQVSLRARSLGREPQDRTKTRRTETLDRRSPPRRHPSMSGAGLSPRSSGHAEAEKLVMMEEDLQRKSSVLRSTSTQQVGDCPAADPLTSFGGPLLRVLRDVLSMQGWKDSMAITRLCLMHAGGAIFP